MVVRAIEAPGELWGFCVPAAYAPCSPQTCHVLPPHFPQPSSACGVLYGNRYAISGYTPVCNACGYLKPGCR